MIHTYQQAKEYLKSFINYERMDDFVYKKSLKLERVFYLLDCLGINFSDLKVIHIAGTKGKGSTAHFCGYLLAEGGRKIGLYTSPHFFDFRERIKIFRSSEFGVRSQLISKKKVIDITKEISLKLSKTKIPEKLGSFSFFEIYTAIAFKFFLDKKVDFVVLETGLGGRLDATNVVTPLVSVITHIGYDHTDKLGKKLEDIALEKAGIIKRKVPVVCAPQREAALGPIKRKLKLKEAQLFLLGKEIKVCNVRLVKKYTLFDFSFAGRRLNNLKIFLKGRHQVDNASLALAVVILLEKKGVIKNELDLRQGLEDCCLEGRFEVLRKSPLTVVDIAHNVSSFSALGNNLKTYFSKKKIILIFACCRDKDAKNMLKQINYSHVILTRLSTSRRYDPQVLKKICCVKDAVINGNFKSAYEEAIKKYDKNSLILVSGSFFLVSDAKKLISAKKGH